MADRLIQNLKADLGFCIFDKMAEVKWRVLDCPLSEILLSDGKSFCLLADFALS